jgi:HNH endonuclease
MNTGGREVFFYAGSTPTWCRMRECGVLSHRRIPSTLSPKQEDRMSTPEHTIKTVLGEPYYSRFWNKVEKTATCWLWTGDVSTYGYAQFHLGSRAKRITVKGHRLSYEMFLGPITEGMTLDHKCRVRRCVNPAHLEPVSARENVRRGLSIPAQNARKRVCQHGHPFNGLNTKWRKNPPGRDCKACDAERQRRYRQMRKHGHSQ